MLAHRSFSSQSNRLLTLYFVDADVFLIQYQNQPPILPFEPRSLGDLHESLSAERAHYWKHTSGSQSSAATG
jgi:hypothetical protein